MPDTRLTRSETEKIVGGVCGGIAAYLQIDPVLVRLAFILLIFASGIGLPIYLILWVIMPRTGDTNKPNATIVQENFEEISHKVSSGMAGRPGTIGVILVLLGLFFLSGQFGMGSHLIWPLLIIGVGAYLLISRNQQ